MALEAFVQFSVIIIATVLIAGIIRIFKQPIVMAYLLAGIIVGPTVLNIAQGSETLAAFSSIGITLLLFMVGLSLNPSVMKEVGKTALLAGFGQIIFTAGIGYYLAQLLGYTPIVSAYIALALTFSSTIIVMKLLSDKGEMDTLHGRLAAGILIVQDFVSIVALILIASVFGLPQAADTSIVQTLLKGGGLILMAFLAGTYLLPHLTKFIAKSQEFLFLFSLSWCLMLAVLFEKAGLSIEIGSLLAGVTLALSPYRFEITAKMKPLRDFFIILFFIYLGSQMVFTNFKAAIPAIIILSIFVLVGKPLITMAIMGTLGYTKRNSTIVGGMLAQVSEFSLILITLGIKVGHLSSEVLSVMTTATLITIAGSSYFIMHSHPLYNKLSPYLNIFERKGKKVDEHKHLASKQHEIILFGYNRIGYSILQSFKKIKKKFLIIDYNPQTISQLAQQGHECIYGDAGNLELLNELDFSKVKMIVSSVPDLEANRLIIKRATGANKKAIVIVISHQIDDALHLYQAGATYVIMPHFLGGHHTSLMIEEYGLDMKKFLKEKSSHIKDLKQRKQMGHEHPKHERESSV